MYTSGCPKIQKKCIQIAAEPPACVSKKWPPKYRSMSSMICAAESGVSAIRTIPDITRLSQANNGIRPSVILGHREEKMVAIKLMAVPMLPNPETNTAIVQ